MAEHKRSRYAAGAISATALGHLLGEASGARAQGEMTWTSNKPLDVRGRADVVTGVLDVAGAYLQISTTRPAPGISACSTGAPTYRSDGSVCTATATVSDVPRTS